MKNKKMSLLFLFFTILMSMVSGNSYAYDFAVENDDGVTFYYNYINDGKDLEVVGVALFFEAYKSDIQPVKRAARH